MSQSPVRRVQARPAPAPSAPSGRVSTRSAAPAPDLGAPIPSRTPRLLQRLQVLVVLAVIIAGALSTWVIADLQGDLAEAPNLTPQYARLGQVQHDLSTAARLADESVLLKESADSARAKDAVTAVVDASGLLVQAAKDRPQDAEALQAIGGDVLRFSLTLSAAAGQPVGKATPILANAHKQLDAVLGEIDQLQAQLGLEAAARPWSQTTPAVVLVSLAMLAVLAWVSWVVAQRSHRVLNLGLVGAAISLLILIGVTAAAQGTAGTASDASRSTQFTHVVNSADAIRHLDAAQQVLTTAVLTQTWDASAQTAYTTEFTAASTAGKAEHLPKLTGFSDAQGALANQMSKGDWSAAATSLLSGKSGALASEADAFRRAGAQTSQRAVDVAATAPTSARTTLIVQLVLVIMITLAGASLGVLGLYQRLREYR